MNTCRHCRAALPVGANVCHRCGKHVAEKPDKRLTPLASGGFLLLLIGGTIGFANWFAGFLPGLGLAVASGVIVAGILCIALGQRR